MDQLTEPGNMTNASARSTVEPRIAWSDGPRVFIARASREAWRAALLVLIVLAGAFTYYQRLDERDLIALGITDISTAAVFEQMNRATHAPNTAEILAIGDSSCLMGIDFIELARLTGRTTNSLCSIGFMGPAGYTVELERYLHRGIKPDRLLLVFHPVQFIREDNWEIWETFVTQEGRNALAHRNIFMRAQAVLAAVFSSYLGHALPGRWGRYFGTLDEFTRSIAADQGGTIDPLGGLRWSTETEFADALAKAETPAARSFSPRPNSLFMQALDTLAPIVGDIGPERTFIIIAPVPDTHATADDIIARSESADAISARLNLPSGHVLPTPASLPYLYFSDRPWTDPVPPTHLNRWGRRSYTRILASILP